MTLTLWGRFQTRILTALLFQMPFSIVWAFVFGNFEATVSLVSIAFIVGILHDVLYQLFQYKDWDDEWSLLYVVMGGVIEGAYVLLLIHAVMVFLPDLTYFHIPIVLFLKMYSLMWLGSFLLQQAVLPLLFPYRRFRGGEI